MKFKRVFIIVIDSLPVPVDEGLGEVRGVGVEVIWVTAGTLPPDGQRVGNGAFDG